MPRLDRRPSIFLAMLAAVALAACGGDSPFPTSPTSYAAQSAANAQGVTLTGTVLGSASSVSALSTTSDPDATTVSVEGTDISTTIDSSGTFTLRGLPEGSFILVFTDAGSAEIGRLEFSEVLPNQEITITVDVSATTVTLVEQRRNGISHGDIEIQGNIEAVLGVDPVDGYPRFIIGGYTVVVQPGVTAIRQGGQGLTVDDLNEGDQVHVKGVWLDPVDGDPDSQEVLAHEIKLQEEDDDAPGPVTEPKITICHKGKNTLTISQSAWPAHQAHGDTLGACS